MKFSRQIETSLRKLGSIDEVIPFKSAAKVKSGLSQKYNDLDAYTFGIELEFRPKGASDVDMEQLEYELSRDDDVMSDFITWRNDHSERDNSNWNGNKDTWDDDYGALPVDIWDDHNPKPNKADFEDEDEYDDALQQWESDRADVEHEYDNYTHWDYYYNDFIQELINDDEWETYISRDSVTNSNNEDVEELIEIAKEYIVYKLDEDVSDDGEAEKDLWGVGEDESGVVEIRSRHLTQNDFGLVTHIVKYVSQFELGGDLSAHVHVGLPDSFDLFDLLAITTLVDEKSIAHIGNNREFSKYSAFRDRLQNAIVREIRKSYAFSSSETYSFTMKFDELQKMLVGVNRYYGTNITSMRTNKTIEFRYFSSEMAANVDRFIEWIKYFLLLPKVAESRNRIILSSGKNDYDDKLLAIRDGSDQVKFILYRDKKPKSAGSHKVGAADLKKNAGIYTHSKKLADKLQVRKTQQQLYNYIQTQTYDSEKVARHGMDKKYIGTIEEIDFSNTVLADLPDILTCVRRTCNLRDTRIKSLNNLRWIGYDGVGGKKGWGSLYISNTPIKELPNGLHVSNNIYADQTPLTTLPADIDVGNDISLRGSYIQYLPSTLEVFGFLALDSSKIHTFDPNIRVLGKIYIGNTPLLDEILRKHPKLKQYLGKLSDGYHERIEKHNMFAEVVRPLYFPNVEGRIETTYEPFIGSAPRD